VIHTISYGLGEFAYFLPKEKYAPFLAKAVGIVKSILSKEDAFEEENLI